MKELDNIIQMKKDALAKCPWHKQATVEDFFEFVQSEMQELKEAFEKNDLENIKEEIGDMYWVLTSLAIQMEKEGKLDLKECLQKTHAKIKNRLRHVYGDAIANTPEDAVRIWLEAKKEEK